MARQLHISIPTICRVLHFQLKITLKKPTKLSLKASPFTQYDLSILSIFYNPEQLLFVDECSVTSRDVHRTTAWRPLGKDACVGIKQLRGPKSISVLASFDVNGFVTWKSQKCAFTNSFHRAFVETIIPIMNPFPLPRSIIVLDNCSIHHYTELEQIITLCGGVLLFNAPYSPWLACIENGFSYFKRMLRRMAKECFDDTYLVIDHCMLLAGSKNLSLFSSCGYDEDQLNFAKIRDPAGVAQKMQHKKRKRLECESSKEIECEHRESPCKKAKAINPLYLSDSQVKDVIEALLPDSIQDFVVWLCYAMDE